MKKIIVITSILLLSGFILSYDFYNKNIENTKSSIKLNNNMISMMIATEAGSGNYSESSSSVFPGEGYVFNSELSGCENGSKLSFDEQNKKVILQSNVSDKCYVYFDIYVEQIKTFSEYIASQYTGVQGENGLYYHDSSLAN